MHVYRTILTKEKAAKHSIVIYVFNSYMMSISAMLYNYHKKQLVNVNTSS